MRLQRCLSIGLVSACLSISAWIAVPDAALAQGAPTISTVTLQVVPGQQGECVVTPKGMVVPLPGAGVNSNNVQIYMGSQGGFWYVDKNGQNVDLTAYVEQFRSMSGGQAQTAPVPQYAAAPAPVNVYNEQAPSSGGSGYGVAGMATTAAAAGLGAMAGSAMSGAYYNNGYYHGVPYGTPMTYPRGGQAAYVNAGGNTVNVNHSYQGASGNTVAAANVNNAHADSMQKQQDWYQNQAKQNPQQFKSWQQSSNGANPFVNQSSQGRFGRGGAATANADGEGGRQGRFGRGGDDAGGQAAAEGGRQGRFGRGGDDAGGQAAAGGGRFGGRGGEGGGQAAAEGGRFGGRGGEASGRFGGGEAGGRAGGGRSGRRGR